MRFNAPEHTSSAYLSNGVFNVENGILEVPDDTPAGDLAALASYGFTAVPNAPAPTETKPVIKAPDAPAVQSDT